MEIMGPHCVDDGAINEGEIEVFEKIGGGVGGENDHGVCGTEF